jgi:hypothetical protein
MVRPFKIEFGREGWKPHVSMEWRGYDLAVGFWSHPEGKPWAFVYRAYYDGEWVALWVGPFSVCVGY